MNAELVRQPSHRENISLLGYFEHVAETAQPRHVRRLHVLYAAQEKWRLGLTDCGGMGIIARNRIQAGSEGNES
jgi:hypothetical protein